MTYHGITYEFKDIGYYLKARIEDWYFLQIVESKKSTFINPIRANTYDEHDYTFENNDTLFHLEIKIRNCAHNTYDSGIIEKRRYDYLKPFNSFYLNIYPDTNKYRIWNINESEVSFSRCKMPIDYVRTDYKDKQVAFLPNCEGVLGSVHEYKHPKLEDLMEDRQLRVLTPEHINHLNKIIINY